MTFPALHRAVTELAERVGEIASHLSDIHPSFPAQEPVEVPDVAQIARDQYPIADYRNLDPDADRPCSCEQSTALLVSNGALTEEVLSLRAAVLELQNQLMAMAAEKERWRLLHDEQSLAKSLAVQRAVTAESDANVNRLKLELCQGQFKAVGERAMRAEARVRELEHICEAAGKMLEENQEDMQKRYAAESEARALREELQKEHAAHGREKFNHEATWNDLKALRERIGAYDSFVDNLRQGKCRYDGIYSAGEIVSELAVLRDR